MDTPIENRKPRGDDRPLWDIYRGAYGYFAMHLAHRHGIFLLLERNPQTLGLRLVYQMTPMTIRLYNERSAAYLTSGLY